MLKKGHRTIRNKYLERFVKENIIPKRRRAVACC